MREISKYFPGLIGAVVLFIAGLIFSGQAEAALQLDSALLNVASPAQGPASVVYVTGGGTIIADVTGQTIGNTNWRSTSWQVGTGAVICVNHADFNNNNASTTFSISVTAPAAAGTYGASFIAYDKNGCSGNASNTLTLAGSIVVDNTAPTVTSIVRTDPSPTNAASVSWTVNFTEPVVGPGAGNFTLVQAGGVNGAAITTVTGSGTTWTVTASTGTGSGTLGLNLNSAAGITDLAGNGLAGVPVTGAVYTVNGSTAATVTASPTLCVNDTGIGTQPWSGLGNVGSQDNVFAQASGINGQVTNYLKCMGYGFSIPAGATIHGITVGVWDYSRRTMRDQSMVLVKANVDQTGPLGTMDLATSTPFTGSNSQVIYGSATNLWGNAWTAADINSANFGAAFAAIRGPYNSTDTAFVDYMPITVDYSVPSTPTVASINLASTNPSSPATAVSWTVTFSTTVTGVAAGNFALVQSGGVSGANITSVSGSGTTWTVNANSGSGTGMLGLNMINATGISPVITATMPFVGQIYTVAIPAVSGVVNTYYPATSSVAAGATSITLGASIGATTPISPGDTLIIMQMQDATIDSSNTSAYGSASSVNAGLYEYAIAGNAVALGGGTLTLSCATKNSYTNAAATTTSGQKRYQIIRVPVYTGATLTSGLTASAWNGSAGGVLAIDVNGALALNSATVSVNGMGFRGGAGRHFSSGSGANTDYRTPVTNLANGSKGEGIAGTPRYVLTAPSTSTDTTVDGYPNGSFARGAPGNAGGGGTDRDPPANDQNPGGGGGGNAGAGGMGGIGWCPTFNAASPPLYGCGPNSGGLGGNPVSGLGATRLTMGGGGGAGTSNDATGSIAELSSSGVAGGGIIMIRAGSLTGTATFNANGNDGDDSVRNDGSGGGGAGGVVLISAASGIGGVTINVRGGKGGNNLMPPGSTATPHGPGGGGGGGYAITTGVPAASSAAAGANGVTYNNGVLFGAYGATTGSAGSLNTVLSAAAIPGTTLGAASCVAQVHHFEIQSSGTGVTCTPGTLTIKACADALVPCTPYTFGVSGTLSKNGTPTANWSGGNGFTIASGSSTVTKAVQVTTAGNVVFDATSIPSTLSATTCNFGSPSCTFTASDAGFLVSAPDHIAETMSTLTVRAVKKADNSLSCVPAFASTGKSINLKCAYIDPNSGTLPVRIGGTALNAAGNTASACDGAGANVALAFDANGIATPSVQYADVGNMQVSASFAGTAGSLDEGLIMTGGGNFIAMPASFGFSAITPGPIKSGNPFSATVKALNAAGAITPNFGKEAAPEGVNLKWYVTTPSGVGAPGSLAGTINIPGANFQGATRGVATVTDLTWDEAGMIRLTANVLDGNYLGSGVSTTGSISAGSTSLTVSSAGNISVGSTIEIWQAGNNGAPLFTTVSAISGTTVTLASPALATVSSVPVHDIYGDSPDIGLFIPDHFDTAVVASTSSPMPCPTGLTCPTLYPGFVYSGQPFSLQVTAKSLAGNTTTNYDSGYGLSNTVNLTAWDALGSTVPQNAGALTNATMVSTAFVNGVGATNTQAYTFAVSPTSPTDIFLRAVDAVYAAATSRRATPSTSVEGGVKVVSGKVKISNAYGSEVLPLPLTVTVKLWNGTRWVTSTTDNLTQFNTNLSAAGGSIIASIVTGLGSGISVATPAVVTVVGGIKTFTLNKPLLPGTVDISLNAPVYLLGGSNGGGVNPSVPGRATFGVYKGANEFIYLRENY